MPQKSLGDILSLRNEIASWSETKTRQEQDKQCLLLQTEKVLLSYLY